jgi:hypothetical protein
MAASVVRGDFVYNGDGQMFVTQTALNSDWVQIKIDIQTTKSFDTIVGGFAGSNTTLFSQNPAGKAFALGGETDTAFVGAGSGVLFLDTGSVDTSKELSTIGATWLAGSWGPLNSRYMLLQLVVSTGGEVRAFETGDSGYPGLALLGGGERVGVITGSMSAVPEPSSIALSLIGCVCGIGVVVARRRRRSVE